MGHLAAPMLLREQEQQQIVSGWVAAKTARFTFNVENQVHCRIAQFRMYTKTVFTQFCVQAGPLRVERLQSWIRGESGVGNTHTRVQPASSNFKIAQDRTVTLYRRPKFVGIKFVERSAIGQKLATLGVV